jgi:ABC-type branched-subunit amino acid transport system substrate-binding protein
MLRSKKILLVTLAAVTVLAAACSSTKSPAAVTSASASAKHTYTIGILGDLTGLGASSNKTIVQGVEAGIVLAKEDGFNIKYVVGDTETSNALSAAQKLVDEDHVFAVIACSSVTLTASRFLTSEGIPVIGAAEDGPEWITSLNMFSVFGPIDTTKVATTAGLFFKKEGVTNVGAVGYSISPLSAEATEAAGVSAQHAGLKAGYINSNFPFGSTNVQPVALAMKAAGVNGVTASVEPNTGYALITALRQVGANIKAVLLATGYGGDLLQAGPGAIQAAQNVYFLSSFEPIEMHTAATEQFTKILKKVGINEDPTYAEYIGYTSIALLDQGLKAAGSNPTQPKLIRALAGIKSFNAVGLFGNRSLNLGQRTNIAIGVDNCYWVTKLSGSKFLLVPGADPICGSIIPGKTVAPAS